MPSKKCKIKRSFAMNLLRKRNSFIFEDFDLLDRVNLEEEVVVENSEDTDDAIERQLDPQERGRWVNVLQIMLVKSAPRCFVERNVCQLAAKGVTEPFEATLAEIRKFIRNTRAQGEQSNYIEIKVLDCDSHCFFQQEQPIQIFSIAVPLDPVRENIK